MNRLIAGIAATGFVLSAIVHGISIMGVNLSDVAPVWGLHFGIFILIVPVAISGWRRPATRPTVRAILMALPVWVRIFALVLIIYTFFNFFICFADTSGSPAIKAGQYVLEDHGKIIRNLSAAEYAALNAQVVRGFSGHWMFFYFAAFAYFAYCGTTDQSPTHNHSRRF